MSDNNTIENTKNTDNSTNTGENNSKEKKNEKECFSKGILLLYCILLYV